MMYGTLFLTFVGALMAQVNPLVLKYTVDEVTNLTQLPNPMDEGIHVLVIISSILLGKEIINIFIQFGQKFYGEKIRINTSSVLAQTAIDKILTYSVAFYTNENHETGKLQQRIDRGIESLTKLVQNFFIDILPLFSNAIIALVIMYMQNVYVGLVSTIVVPIYFAVSSMQAKKLAGVRRQLRNQREKKTSGLLNLINSIMVIKSFVREKFEGEKQYDLQMQLMESQLFTRKTNFFYDGLKTFIEQFGVVLIILLTVYLVLDQQMTIGAIMLHILLFNNVSAPIRQLHRIYDDMNDAMIYAEGYFDILNADDQTEPNGIYIEKNIKGKFELQNVDFTYPNGMKALHHVSMNIQAGKTTALVGLSGAGKSTVINLLCKFYLPDSGNIFLDDVELNDFDNTALRNDIGLVLQKNHIFQGSIEDNIRYGNMNATFEEIETAAKKAYLHDQIMDLPEQYNHDATQLSGGQQQRIAIARLFLKDPPIIFLDEPTASLDAIATEQIKNSLDAIKEGRTVVIISHSLSQILDSDCIYVMEKGRVVESGTHDELINLNGSYRDIFDASARSLNLDKLMSSFKEN
ncbi:MULTISPECIES: ABC transporter ATP-binding protein [unclassified Kaistella]|uniref:ABC transporter ATP-binding protein n=1 Tax=unclassified Kaistella TaxID=2762626 RepID=UPI0027360053|nr:MULTISPECIES: ABC transporter ATP-binding protein [unclassified Kaistella]MCZ2085026.1 ABC transporter ATP-binding protein/permease [Flavobacteriales bacterium]MDP2453691.1 ABC transporter ATP-binding protein [Kaistella sp. SH11-4b]MDP2456748.1 ABC transporter ATP-binding protein [Kaistella sp. SH40-3]MDP2459504.1 ABC transporter ATP-binding protein [Kaistella sp. SH19-2b]